MTSSLVTMGFSPALIFILGGIVFPFLPKALRYVAILALPLITLAYIWQIPLYNSYIGFSSESVKLVSFSLYPITSHSYSHIFATAFAIAMLASGIFSLNQNRTTETTAAFISAGSAIGVTFAGDLITLFLFWEIMAIASTLIIWCGNSESSHRAGIRYAYLHFFGGVILLAGIAAHIAVTNSMLIPNLTTSIADIDKLLNFDIPTVAAWLILVGMLINTATPPLSSWLADAYPESSVSGMVFLSAFTTKTAVFTLLTIFAGSDILIYLGLFMVFYGIIYAILENDMRRILAYSIVNQVGFMVTAIGIGTEIALNGAAAHAFCHIIYKALLLMSAGSVLYMTGRRRCTELGGLYHTMKITMICGIIGALSISAFPLTSGFISKSLIAEAAHNEKFEVIWYLLAAASAGVFLHAGIKFPWFVFFHKDSGLRPQDPPLNMQIAMLLLALLCLVPGTYPQTVYFMLPTKVPYDAYMNGYPIAQLQLLLFSGLAFFLMLPLLKRTRTISLDFDWSYRVVLKYILSILELFCFFIKNLIGKLTIRGKDKLCNTIARIHGPEGVMARNWPIGTTVLWIAALFAVYSLFYYKAL